MKLRFFSKTKLQLIIIFFTILNAGLLFCFLRSPDTEELNSGNQASWKSEDYPEILDIKDSNWDFQKLSQFFKDLSSKRGGEYAYHALTVSANKGYLTPNVDSHLLGHVVGDVLYKQKGIDGIKVCTDDIRNACSHSIVVGYLLDNGAESISKAVATCEGAPGGIGAYTMCVHGLGHGVLAYEGYDMRRAVDLCGKTGTAKYGNQEVGQCVGGVTMEMMAGVHDRMAWEKQLPNYFKENDPLAPCNMGFIPKEALSFCYVYLTPRLFQSAGADLSSPDPKYFKKAMSYCENIPRSDGMREICFGSFGKEYVVLANTRNVQSIGDMDSGRLRSIYDWCSFGPKEALSPCLDSALQSLYWGGENDPGVSIKFCGIIPDKEHSDKCMRSLIGAVSYYMGTHDSYKESFCEKIPDEYRENCRLSLSIKSR